MSLPKSLTTVTRFSKYLAMGLFIILPLLSFFLGIQYEKKIKETNTVSQIKTPESILNEPYIHSLSFPALKGKVLSSYGLSEKPFTSKTMEYKGKLFSFQYPTDFTLLEDKESTGVVSLLKEESVVYYKMPQIVKVTIAVRELDPYWSYSSLNDLFIQKSLSAFIYAGKVDPKRLSVWTTSLSGEKALFVDYPGDASYHHSLLALHKQKAFSVSITGSPMVTGAAEAYEKIVETFSFNN